MGDEQRLNNDMPLMLPAPRPSRHTPEDPYESLPGAVPTSVTTEPIKREMTGTDIKLRKQAQLDAKVRGARYDRYLDAMTEHDGDQEKALADVYNLPVEQVRLQRAELHADVRLGMASSSLGEALEQNDLALAARVTLLRKHAYSPHPGASLKAIDMANAMEGGTSDLGSFESFLRTVKAQKGSK